jgi:DNA-binding MarR family transcriptional regulator
VTGPPDDVAPRSGVERSAVDALVEGTQAFGGLIAESLASVDARVTMPQLRVLVLAASGPQNVTAVARDLGVHPSNATRTCDRLVRAGLLTRRHAPDDRRQVILTLTPAGTRLVEQVMSQRRAAAERVLARMSVEHRAMLAEALSAFAAATASTNRPG